MKRIAVIFGLFLGLAACSPLNTSYEVHIGPKAASHKQDLEKAIPRVINGRLAALKQSSTRTQLSLQGTGGVLRVAISDANVKSALQKQLTTPFSFHILVSAPKGQATVTDPFGDGFKETGITEKDLQWVETGTTNDGKGSATITFTPEGQKLFQKIAKENAGKEIAIFSRESLKARKTISMTDAQKESIQIDGIPSPAIAQTFADDVNVGTHVTFLPLEEKKP